MARKTEPDSSAFPRTSERGLTKREHIAALIMASMNTGNEIAETYHVALDAVRRADQLIEALNRRPTNT